MVVIHSQRAKELLLHPEAYREVPTSLMKPYPGDDFDVWTHVECEDKNVKKMSFTGTLSDYEKVIFEALAKLIRGKNLGILETLSLRECEAYLRDRNSARALEGFDPQDEIRFKKFFSWLRLSSLTKPALEYNYPEENGPFRSLKLVDKVKELKAFLNSPEILSLYQNRAHPELVDVEDLTVFVQAPYHSEQDRAIFEELHLLGVTTFQEENLNFIPEA